MGRFGWAKRLASEQKGLSAGTRERTANGRFQGLLAAGCVEQVARRPPGGVGGGLSGGVGALDARRRRRAVDEECELERERVGVRGPGHRPRLPGRAPSRVRRACARRCSVVMAYAVLPRSSARGVRRHRVDERATEYALSRRVFQPGEDADDLCTWVVPGRECRRAHLKVPSVVMPRRQGQGQGQGSGDAGSRTVGDVSGSSVRVGRGRGVCGSSPHLHLVCSRRGSVSTAPVAGDHVRLRALFVNRGSEESQSSS